MMMAHPQPIALLPNSWSESCTLVRGWPHLGHALARSLIRFPHARHVMSAMIFTSAPDSTSHDRRNPARQFLQFCLSKIAYPPARKYFRNFPKWLRIRIDLGAD